MVVAFAANDLDLLAGLDPAIVNAADANSSHIVVVLNAGDLNLQRFVRVAVRSRNVLQQRLEDGNDVRSRLPVPRRGALPGRWRRAPGNRASRHRRPVRRTGRRLRSSTSSVRGIGPVNLVDHHDRPQFVLERLFEDEARLRHRPFSGIDQKEHAIGHAQHPLDFAAEIGVAGSVDQIDLGDRPLADRVY